MAGRSSEITEYLIGTNALGRPEDFSPLEDSSVRTRAYELRQRLQKYYSTENAASTLHIELPKGSYVPRFVPASPPSPVPMRRKPIHIPGWIAGFLAGAAMASVIAFFAVPRSPGTHLDPAVRRAWAPLMEHDPELLVCISTPLHLLVSPYMETVPLSTPKFPAPPELYPLFNRYRPLPGDAKLEMHPVQKAVTMGDVQALAKVVDTLMALPMAYRILPESNAPLTAMHNRNVLLIGSPWYSRAVTTLLEAAPWTARLDPESKEIGLFGSHGRKLLPKRGERGEYQEVFGLLTVLQSDQDDGRTKVILSGLTSVGVHAAAAFFTSPRDMRGLSQRFRQQGLAEWPRSYQAIVRCRASDDTQLLSYAYETHEVIRK